MRDKPGFGQILGLLFLVYFIASIVSLLVITSGPAFGEGNVAVIDVSGVILAQGVESTLFSSGILGSQDYIDRIEAAAQDDRFDAIVLRIDSGGGSPVGSREIVEAVRDVEKPVVAYIREIGASGAYWVAAASDEVIADPLAITGSVGVRASYLEFSGLFDEYGIGYERVNGGEFKDIGTPFANLTDEERVLLLDRIDYLHEYFFSSVVEMRNISSYPNESLETIRSGIYFIGPEAVELGLVDSLGSWDSVEDALLARGLESVSYATIADDAPLLTDLAGFSTRFGEAIGSGIGSAFSEKPRFE